MSEEKSKLLCQCPKQSSEMKKIYVTLCGHRVICRTLITNKNSIREVFGALNPKSKPTTVERLKICGKRDERKQQLPICYIVDTYWMPEKVHIAHKFQRTLALFHNLISQL